MIPNPLGLCFVLLSVSRDSIGTSGDSEAMTDHLVSHPQFTLHFNKPVLISSRLPLYTDKPDR